jgi:hypothetical protein
MRAVLLMLMCFLLGAPAMANEARQVEIAFCVDASGTLLSAEYLTNPRGDFSWPGYKNAMQSIEASAPFLALPEGAGQNAQFIARFVYSCKGPWKFTVERVTPHPGVSDIAGYDWWTDSENPAKPERYRMF